MKKIFLITLSIFLIICFCTIPKIEKEKTLRANMLLEDSIGFANQKVYLLNNNNYFVEVDVFLNPIDQDYPIQSIFNTLKISNNSLPLTFSGYIPADVELLNYQVVDSVLYLNLSKEFDNYDNKDFILSGLVHSYLINNNYLKVSISIDSVLRGVYDSNYPINEEGSFTSRRDIDKVVVYYIDSFDNNHYYVPIFKYMNDDRDKICIILDELKDNIPNSLVSYIDDDLELLDSKIENDVLILSFNSSLLNDKKEENIKLISSSVFQNYDVSAVLFQVNDKIEEIVTKPKKP